MGMALVALSLKISSLEGSSTELSPQDLQSITCCGSGGSGEVQLMPQPGWDWNQSLYLMCLVLFC